MRYELILRIRIEAPKPRDAMGSADRVVVLIDDKLSTYDNVTLDEVELRRDWSVTTETQSDTDHAPMGKNLEAKCPS